MSTIIPWLTLVATLLTSAYFAMVVTQLAKRPKWPSWLKEVTAIVASALVGLATAWQGGRFTPLLSGHLTPSAVTGICIIVYATASTFYHVHFAYSEWMEDLANV